MYKAGQDTGLMTQDLLLKLQYLHFLKNPFWVIFILRFCITFGKSFHCPHLHCLLIHCSLWAMLQTWRVVTQRVYPGRADLLALLPKPSDLSLSKLTNGGWIMTDTCNPARKFRKLFMAAITEIAEEEGMTKNEITIYEAGKSYQYMHVYIHYYTNINVLNLYFLIFTTRLLASSPQCLGWRSD